MDAETVGAIVGTAVPLILAGTWLLRIEGRLNAHERGCEERQKRLDERHDEIGKKLDHINTKLDRLVEGR